MSPGTPNIDWTKQDRRSSAKRRSERSASTLYVLLVNGALSLVCLWQLIVSFQARSGDGSGAFSGLVTWPLIAGLGLLSVAGLVTTLFHAGAVAKSERRTRSTATYVGLAFFVAVLLVARGG